MSFIDYPTNDDERKQLYIRSREFLSRYNPDDRKKMLEENERLTGVRYTRDIFNYLVGETDTFPDIGGGAKRRRTGKYKKRRTRKNKTKKRRMKGG